MSDPKTCETCRFSVSKNAFGAFSECRRNSPRPFLERLTLARMECSLVHEAMIATFPLVANDDWCGDWEAQA